MAGQSEGRTVPRNRSTALYYPNIVIQDGPWLRNALLYWDELASVVPDVPPGGEPIQLSIELEFLADNGMYRPLSPSTVIGRTGDPRDREDIRREFLRTLRDGLLADEREKPREWRIHTDKMEMGLFRDLERLQVAERDEAEGGWYRVSDGVGLYYMSLLANKVAARDSPHTVPGTDIRLYRDLTFRVDMKRNDNPCLDVTLADVLPVPSSSAPLADLIDFRQRHPTELGDFRDELRRIFHLLAQTEEERRLVQVVESEHDRLARATDRLAEAMSDSKLLVTLGSLSTVIQTAMAGQTSFSIKTALLTGTLAVTTLYLMKRSLRRDRLRTSPVTYLYEAHGEGLLTSA